jgi:hypothetical protein
MCGGPSVVAVDDAGNPFSGPGPFASASAGSAPSGVPTGAEATSFADALRPLFNEVLEYIRDRDKQREDRLVLLDNAENERRERVAHGKAELLGQATTLIDKLTELAESVVTYVDTIVFRAKNAPDVPPAS